MVTMPGSCIVVVHGRKISAHLTRPHFLPQRSNSAASPHLLRQPTPDPTRRFTNAGFLTGKMGAT